MIHSVLDFLERNAEQFPDKKALADDQSAKTYKEYEADVRKIAGYLLKSVAKNRIQSPVAVLIDRNIQCIEAFLGIAATGNFYVPVDPSLPSERISTILNELKPLAVINAAGEKCQFENAVLFEDILASEFDNDEEVSERMKEIIDTDPLYAIFTSGSTGIPKGVLISHRGVIDLLNAFEEAFSFPSDSVFGNQAPFDFDVSVKDIYNALYCGGTVQVVPKKMFVMPKELIAFLSEKGVNTIIWAVSAVRIVSDFKVLDTTEKEAFPKLKYVMFSGEVMPVKSLNYWMDYFKDTVFVNLYGPTEITCNCTYAVIDKKYDINESLPIGKSFTNTRVYLLNKDLGIIRKKNEIGEIAVEGSGLALGYYNNPEKTNESFILHPEIRGYRNVLYRTGDLGYYGENGDIFFANRSDSQIKHMGHRIELGEIETALNAVDFLGMSCCLYDKQKEKIICIYQAEDDKRKDIVRELGKKMPKYMWPNKYIRYDAMPMNSHGKIDRAKLKKDILE